MHKVACVLACLLGMGYGAWINIVNEKTHECITVPDKGYELYMAACGSSPGQAWKSDSLQTEFQSKANGKCLDRPGDRSNLGDKIGSWACWHYSWGAQNWEVSEGLIKATSNSQTCLSADASGKVVLGKCSGNMSKWRFQDADPLPLSLSCINIVNEKTKECIAAPAKGYQLYMAPCSSSPAQAWKMDKEGSWSSSFEFLNKANGKCLDRPGDRNAVGNQIGTWGCWHYTWGAQTWHLSEGLIKASDAQRCLSTDYHGHVVLDKCSKGLAKWRIENSTSFSLAEKASKASHGSFPVFAIIATMFAAVTLATMTLAPRVVRRFRNGRVEEPLLAETGAGQEEQ
mmetsp:Transcript_154439/g.272709  ORF Transcript_154439/g.272709 Transcript_154439/m.272709 type:complete len:342 (+) Transcript_154439:75-1100(+)